MRVVEEKEVVLVEHGVVAGEEGPAEPGADLEETGDFKNGGYLRPHHQREE
jgi:hypothetical protein